MPPRGFSHFSYSPRASSHSAHDTRRGMYPGMQARVSDAEESEPPRLSQHESSGILESDYGDEEPESPIRPLRRNAGMHARMSDVSESHSGYNSSVGQSYPSQTSLSDNSLDPRDSSSNRDSSPSEDSYIPRNHASQETYSIHRRSFRDHSYRPRFGPYVVVRTSAVRTDPYHLVEVFIC